MFVLIPGAGGNASFWAELVPELERRGHEAVPVDIEQDDPTLGLPEYAGIVAQAVAGRPDTVLVAQSLGGFTAPMAAERLAAERIPPAQVVLLNAMIPLPGERAGDWWDATGAPQARSDADRAAGRSTEFDVEQHFFHDLPPDVRDRLFAGPPPRDTAEIAFAQPCTFAAWPDVPIHVVVGRDDRFFPLEFQRRVAHDRLGLDVDEIDGGHLAALSNAPGLAALLDSYVTA